MQRAAAAVAASASDLLASHSGGRYGRHVMIMVGAGNNGGDALFAGDGWRAGRTGHCRPLPGTPHGRPCGVDRGGWSAGRP